MTTFDELLPALAEIIHDRWPSLEPFLPILINRDLNGRIRLVLDASHQPTPGAPSNHPLLQLAAATLEQGEGIQRASPAKRWVVLTAAAAAAAAAASEAVLAKGGGEGSVTVIDT